MREEWSERVRVVKERLDAAIHKVAESDDSSELEASLLGRKSLIIIRNYVLFLCRKEELCDRRTEQGHSSDIR